jgi:hypothetical protein
MQSSKNPLNTLAVPPAITNTPIPAIMIRRGSIIAATRIRRSILCILNPPLCRVRWTHAPFLR